MSREDWALILRIQRHIASGKWSIPDLIGYFVSIKDTLTKDEIEKLKRTSMFFTTAGSITGTDVNASSKRYLASQLHEPSSENIALGVPVLDWAGAEWDSRSAHAQFTFSLGLLKVLCNALDLMFLPLA